MSARTNGRMRPGLRQATPRRAMRPYQRPGSPAAVAPERVLWRAAKADSLAPPGQSALARFNFPRRANPLYCPYVSDAGFARQRNRPAADAARIKGAVAGNRRGQCHRGAQPRTDRSHFAAGRPATDRRHRAVLHPRRKRRAGLCDAAQRAAEGICKPHGNRHARLF